MEKKVFLRGVEVELSSERIFPTDLLKTPPSDAPVSEGFKLLEGELIPYIVGKEKWIEIKSPTGEVEGEIVVEDFETKDGRYLGRVVKVRKGAKETVVAKALPNETIDEGKLLRKIPLILADLDINGDVENEKIKKLLEGEAEKEIKRIRVGFFVGADKKGNVFIEPLEDFDTNGTIPAFVNEELKELAGENPELKRWIYIPNPILAIKTIEQMSFIGKSKEERYFGLGLMNILNNPRAKGIAVVHYRYPSVTPDGKIVEKVGRAIIGSYNKEEGYYSPMAFKSKIWIEFLENLLSKIAGEKPVREEPFVPKTVEKSWKKRKEDLERVISKEEAQKYLPVLREILKIYDTVYNEEDLIRRVEKAEQKPIEYSEYKEEIKEIKGRDPIGKIAKAIIEEKPLKTVTGKEILLKETDLTPFGRNPINRLAEKANMRELRKKLVLNSAIRDRIFDELTDEEAREIIEMVRKAVEGKNDEDLDLDLEFDFNPNPEETNREEKTEEEKIERELFEDDSNLSDLLL